MSSKKDRKAERKQTIALFSRAYKPGDIIRFAFGPYVADKPNSQKLWHSEITNKKNDSVYVILGVNVFVIEGVHNQYIEYKLLIDDQIYWVEDRQVNLVKRWQQ